MLGYTTRGASGPVTSGTAGSGGAGRGVIPRSNDPMVGGDTGGETGRGAGEGDGTAGVDWQAAAKRMSARAWLTGIRMTEGIEDGGTVERWNGNGRSGRP